MAISGGFGFTLDLTRGTLRRWAMGADGVKRWADTDEAVTDPVVDAGKKVRADSVMTPPDRLFLGYFPARARARMGQAFTGLPATMPDVGPFFLGISSRARLREVHPDLVALTQRAIQLTRVDFAVYEGLRSAARQETLVRIGASWTLDSRHLTGHAVDLVPWADVDGDGRSELRWDWPLIYPIAAAMRQASLEAGVPLLWGGVWDTPLAHLADPLEDAVTAYVGRRRAMGKPARIDGPHFELPRNLYPAPAAPAPRSAGAS